jgi:hypothetical protein
VNRDCEEGLRLRLHFEHTLKEWGGSTHTNGLSNSCRSDLHEFQIEANHAHSELIKARHAYLDHMARCLVCSERLVTLDAAVAIREKLNTSPLQ